MFIGDKFLVRGTVLYAHFFALQLINAGELALLTDEQRRVVIIRGGEQYLLFTLRRDVHPGHDRVETAEFQPRDQAVKGLVGEGTGGIDLFTQRVSQIHIETDDLVVGVHQLKRRVGGLGGETNGLRGGSGEAHACEQGGNQYFFHRHFPEKHQCER